MEIPLVFHDTDFAYLRKAARGADPEFLKFWMDAIRVGEWFNREQFIQDLIDGAIATPPT